ncbi:hypothetical protein BJG93_08625 [Paraburkholderia sprentiae WSM5005]|uniref:Uncharacterized protein n=1 Tax=Paraburkholderia sprentiae WSM5005 TaxID=754502 RepID=A0A1I9YGK2_9BURK|nr:hypothetical protein [Paraburkholderia sprentiae]APA85435.1 hypothetical protein BJG93_08625 [Paraburkholderia sprentiae WSM5005]
MDRTESTISGSSQAALIDHDIAHITRAMHVSLRGDFGGPILPAAYWRKRLTTLVDSGQLSSAQLRKIDSLLLQLDRFASTPLPEWERFAPAPSAPFKPARPVKKLKSV